ncbi:MAG: DNA topoisomerase [Marinobacter sp.]|nr:DNA topoisomerase [Marinobacter sp.]
MRSNYKKVDREKVGSDKGKLVPTDIGNIVNDFLVKNFSNILDFGFTAKVESEFDDIAEGKEDWIKMIKYFLQIIPSNGCRCC